MYCPTEKELQRSIDELEKELGIDLPSLEELLTQEGGGKTVHSFDELKRLHKVNEETFNQIRSISEKLLDVLSKQQLEKTEPLELALSAIAHIDDDTIVSEDLDLLMRHAMNDQQRKALLLLKGKIINLDKIENDNKLK